MLHLQVIHNMIIKDVFSLLFALFAPQHVHHPLLHHVEAPEVVLGAFNVVYEGNGLGLDVDKSMISQLFL